MASLLQIARVSSSAQAPGSGSKNFHPSPSGAAIEHKPRHYVEGGYNQNLKLAVTAANLPIAAEPMGPPAGSTVRIRTSDQNAGEMYFAETREELKQGLGVPLGAGFEIVFPYEKGKLWYMGTTVGDSANLSARSQ